MKLTRTQLTFRRHIRFQSACAHALDLACQEVAIGLLGARMSYPPLTTQMRVLSLIYKRLSAVSDPAVSNSLDADVLLKVITDVGVVLSRLTSAITLWAAMEKTKLMRGWVPAEVAANALATMGDAGTSDTALMTDQGINDLLAHAVPGAGPEFTEAESLLTGAQLVAYARRANDLLPHTPKGAMGRLAMVFLLSWLRHALSERTTSLQMLVKLKGEEAISTRIDLLRTVSAYATGVMVSSAFNVTEHYISWISDSFVSSSMFGSTADSFSRLLQSFRERVPPEGPFTRPQFLMEDKVFDRDIVNLPTFELALNATPQEALPRVNSPNFHPLAGDLIFPLGFPSGDVNRWIDTAWTMIDDAQRATVEYLRTGYDAAPKIQTISHSIRARGDAGIAGVDSTPGYPLVSKWEPTINWSTGEWSLRLLGLDPWCLVTRQHVKQVIARHPHMPVRVTGPSPSSEITGRATLQPYFATFDEARPYLPMTFESLGQLWSTTSDRLSEFIASLGTQTAAPTWRRLAQSLHLVGQLYHGETVIEPFTRAWYHARSFSSECFGASITLSESNKVVLRPFKRVPISALMERVPTALAQVQNGQEMPHLPFLQWVEATDVGPSTVTIEGWTAAEDLRDIVLISTVPRDEGFEIVANDDVGPLGAQRFNAVLAVDTPVPAVAPPVAAPPIKPMDIVG
jgi:hypothetical protein